MKTTEEPQMMTLEQAETQLAALEANYRKKGKVLRAFIAVMKADTDGEEKKDDDE